MRKTLLLFLFPFAIFAQIPTDYYSPAEDNIGVNLKYELNQIIDNHTIFPYTEYGSTDVWDILKETDKDPNNPNNVILIYSGVSVNGPQEYNSGTGWTREHVWAKSRGNFGIEEGPGTDVHALRPLDNSTNSTRSNRGFDNCEDCIIVYDQWSNLTGSKRDGTAWSFEPRNEVKGDVARMLFYMAVRYEGYDGYVDLELSETINYSSDKTPFHGILSTLLEWNRIDPVDSWEENRNDIIYYNYQNNRNPFIDHPELAEYIWGNKTGETWTNSSLSVNEESEISIKLYPNPVSNYINISGLTNKITLEIYDPLGKKILIKVIDPNQNNIDISQLARGIYVFKLIDVTGVTVQKIIVQ